MKHICKKCKAEMKLIATESDQDGNTKEKYQCPQCQLVSEDTATEKKNVLLCEA